MDIPQVDVLAAYLERREETDGAVARVLTSGRYLMGDEVAGFESEFASWLGVGHCVGVGSGTAALELAIRAVGIGAGSAVFTVSHTAVATVAAIELAGATPVLVDVDETSFCMDPASLEAAIQGAIARPNEFGRPGAIVPVHLYGHPANMPRIMAIASEYGLPVIEDCAQALGASREGRLVGTWGIAAAFSFYPTKNLGALGDAGAVATSDAGAADRVRQLAQYGWRERFISEISGQNSRLDELQAAVLRTRLPYVRSDNEARRRLAGVYSDRLGAAEVVLPAEEPDALHVYHQYVVRLENRDAVKSALADAGIGTAVHYPLPVHLQPAFADRLPSAVPLTATEQVSPEILSLPMFPQLSQDRAEVVASTLASIQLPRAT